MARTEQIMAAFAASPAGDSSLHRTTPGDRSEDLAYQRRILPAVSRTFALTIPELPPHLEDVVSNGYLLCRIADTIEDDPDMAPAEKRTHARAFVRAVSGELPPESFARALEPRLSSTAPPAERDLVRHSPNVVRLTRAYPIRERDALARCIAVMAEGMADFQGRTPRVGLADLQEMRRYCYYVAGVVGEMLTELFCLASPAVAARESELNARAVSFGIGLQMTNILKDIWEDFSRGACWLPRAIFDSHGFPLEGLASLHAAGRHSGRGHARFEEGLGELVAIAYGHLADALEYTLSVPATETGIRKFCLWALGMAVLTLRKIDARRGFRSGAEVKISRSSLRAVVFSTSAAAGSDRILRALFRMASGPLSAAPGEAQR